jgi:hypothetical protein
MNDPDVARYNPYVMFRHRSLQNAREEHAAWDGLVLPRDDPWVAAHSTPMGFNCKCEWVPVSERALARLGKDAPDETPPPETWDYVDPRTGQTHTLPKGVQYGFDYVKGQSAAATRMQAATAKALSTRINRLETLDHEIARLNVQTLIGADVFARFFVGDIAGEFPVAVLNRADRLALGAESSAVLLSQESLKTHLASHPEIGLADYRKIQQLIDTGEVYRDGDTRLVYLTVDGVAYRAALKRTGDRRRNYFLTLFKNETGAKPKPGSRIR